MTKTRINCPNCRQSILADLEQIFDVGVDPSAKQRLLSGAFNLVRCPFCGFQGNLATTIVYHDPEKELLLTYVPGELGLPRPEQERMVGNLINQIISHLPQEQRKGYLLQPQAHLTMQSMVERILEADGITREMIEAQQKRLHLLQRLSGASSDDVRLEILRQEEKLVDHEFFALIARLQEAAVATNDQESLTRLSELLNFLLANTSLGRELKEQSEEFQAALRSLQEAGGRLTREKLLEIVMKAESDTRLRALVNLARPGMDYQFFQLLSERIDRARDKGRQRLVELRRKLLEYTEEYDRRVQARADQAARLLENLLKANDIRKATYQNLPAIDDLFISLLTSQIEAARKDGNLERLSKLNQVLDVIKEFSKPSEEITFIEELLDIEDEQERRRFIEANREKVTPQLLQLLSELLLQAQQSEQQKELVERLQAVTRQVRRFSMEAALKGEAH